MEEVNDHTQPHMWMLTQILNEVVCGPYSNRMLPHRRGQTSMMLPGAHWWENQEKHLDSMALLATSTEPRRLHTALHSCCYGPSVALYSEVQRQW